HQLHGRPLAPDDVRLRRLPDLGHGLRARPPDDRPRAVTRVGRYPLLVRADRIPALQRRADGRRDDAGPQLDRGRALHPLRHRHDAVLAVARRRRHVDVPLAPRVRVERLDDASPYGVRARDGGGGAMTFDFGKNHWLLFGVSFLGFIAIAFVVGIGPALWVQNHAQPLPGAQAPTSLETEGLAV